MNKFKKMMISVMSVALLFSLMGTASASENPTETLYGLEVLNTTEETTVNENGVEVTVTTTELNGTKEDLERIVSELKNEGRNIYSQAELTEPEISPLAIGDGRWKGERCDSTSYPDMQICAYADFDAKFRAGGLGGVTFNGNITAIAAIQKQNVFKDVHAIPRLKVRGYGLTAKDSVFVAEWNFTSPRKVAVDSWPVNESAGGFLAYAEFWAGADYSWLYYGQGGGPSGFFVNLQKQ